MRRSFVSNRTPVRIVGGIGSEAVAGKIVVRGAREHNLRGVDLELPRDKLVVFTGLSGSGKSSLAFDTIYAEGQRRYVESLSAYARQFLGQMDKPDVDFIEGLSPAISIDQKSASRNPRSTVGTVTEVYDYLRLLFARVGTPHDPETGEPLVRQTPQQIVDRILKLEDGTRFQVLAPVVRGRKGTYETMLTDLAKEGFVRAIVDDELIELGGELPDLARYETHDIRIVVDRLVRRDGIERRLTDSIETALGLAEGVAEIEIIPPKGSDAESEMLVFSQHLSRPSDGKSFEEFGKSFGSLAPPATSRSTRLMAPAMACDGLGTTTRSIPAGVPNPEPSVAEGAIHPPWSFAKSQYFRALGQGVFASSFSMTLTTVGKKSQNKQQKTDCSMVALASQDFGHQVTGHLQETVSVEFVSFNANLKAQSLKSPRPATAPSRKSDSARRADRGLPCGKVPLPGM
ncbi:UNVERIFIED_CONTAM: hypothetical protein GTU68_034080 [Idotea baltica]|nr:hypothetical protein [Idotea baltica]